MISATQQRDKVCSLAASEPTTALQLARAISDPWFRCQALSVAALHLSDPPARSRALSEAFASANQLSEPNRVVTVSAWPLKVLVLTGLADAASAEVIRLLNVISEEPSPVRKADALRYLFGAVSDAPPAVARRVAERFADACLTRLNNGRRNRKGESHLEECLPVLVRTDSE